MSKIPMASLIILLTINIIYSEKIFKIPFKTDSTVSLFPDQANPIANKFMSQLVIELSIGNPEQKFNCALNLNSYHSLFLSHKIGDIDLTSFYNKDISSSYSCNENMTDYPNEDFSKAESFSDIVKIYSPENKPIFNEELNFLLIDDLAEDEENDFFAPGEIGLKLESYNNNEYPEDDRFVYQIKNKGYTRNCIFTFEFENNGENEKKDNGNFILGKDVYYNNNYLKINIKSKEWVLNFDKVLFGNKEVESPAQAIVETENGLIVGTVDYEDFIKEFFGNQTNCYTKKAKMGYKMYNYYYCDEDFNEAKMENLTFYFDINRKEINFTFSGKELFFLENGKKYFKIIFFTFPNYFWYLGREFLKKYQLFFDTERKIIYVKYNNDFSFISYFNDVDFWTIISLVIAILSVIVFIIFYPKKNKRNKRKKRKNELDDEKDKKQEKLELLN